jgi:tetratricopeptide (TPR) repeat protein
MRLFSLLHTSIFSFCVILAGCATQSKTGESDPKLKPGELDSLMSQVALIEKSGPKSEAISRYEEVAKQYPSSKLPWSRIAQIQFESLNYGEAIVAAQQVVARDEKDKLAHSILSVSGLRVSTKALADLSRQKELDGTVKSEAQSLARLIRESLGERVLVPTTPVDAPRATTQPARPAVARPSSAAPKAAEASEKRGGNPFDVLK